MKKIYLKLTFLSIIAFGIFSCGTKHCNNEKDATEEIENISESAIKNEVINKSINGHEYVDLGLPSGLKWATCNVGANKPEEHGDYYAWGEITTKSKYSKENSKTYETKMDDINGNSNYDVARAKWSGNWRTPTKKEMKELKNECIWGYTTLNGINGMKVTGPNGNSIFLPFAGYCCDTLYDCVDTYGGYWSSTPYENNGHYAFYFRFNNGYHNIDWNFRYLGHPIRPVSD